MFIKEIKIKSVNLFTRIRNKNRAKKAFVLLAGLLVSMAAIAQTPPPTPVETDTLAPFVSSVAVTVFSTSSATMGGNVTGNGGVAVTEYGVVYSSSNAVPTLADSKAVIGNGNGAYSQSVTGLAGGTTYYVRAYATNLIGTSYGVVMTFTTSPVAPTILTNGVSNITNTDATVGGNVISSGGATVTERGIVYSSANTTPTVSDTKVQIGAGTGSFTQALTGLTLATTYYVRSYAINSIGTSYGNVTSFVPGGASVSTDAISGVSATGATVGGNVVSIGGSAVTERGVVYVAGTGAPTIANTKVAIGAGIGTFSQALTSLNAGTIYSLRSYATNSTGTNYGDAQTFTTQSTLSSINRAGATTLTNAIIVNYTVVFGQAITGLTASNFSLTASGLTNASVTGVNGSGTTYTVSVYGGVGAGTLVLNLANSTNISPSLSTTLPFSGQSYTVDRIAPTVTAASIVSSNTVTTVAKTGDIVRLSFSTSEVLAATPTVTIAGRSVAVISSGTNSWSLSTTMTSADTEGPVAFTIDGVDIAGNIGVTGTVTTDASSVIFDRTAPVVSTISRVTPSPTTASAVQYTVTFAEAVTGVDASDFSTNTTNSLSGASVTAVTGSGATYLVSVNTTAGSGFLRLDLKATGTGIADIAGNPITTGFTTGQTYSVQRKPFVKTTPPDPVCTPKAVNLASPVVVAGSDTGLIYNYYSNATATSMVPDAFAVSPAGTYYVVGTNSFGISSDPVPVVVKIETSTPPIRLVVDANVSEPAALPSRTFGVSYLWTAPAGILSDTKIANPYIVTTQEQLLKVAITAPSGCVTVDTVLVRVFDKKIYVPNVFSPNNDGLNDILYVNMVAIRQLYFFRVYNRYGKMVFETSNMTTGWNGRLNGVGDILPSDTYVWTVKGIGLSGGEVNAQGTTTLLR